MHLLQHSKYTQKRIKSIQVDINDDFMTDLGIV
ncbi:hypothetical protein HMPREF9447_03416 [Bacteroides oleiciplenus YIT 12058]|uniref:Uncharacterized protein n=1 Tax=Bacteroides oleiciplenus YIT 12058 TaxID=742727 RepID=K9EEU7_9BACE|nr:hypothetical protein HMPREF9447_03416 [Bacteroides oleiciplenus YIT 12058]